MSRPTRIILRFRYTYTSNIDAERKLSIHQTYGIICGTVHFSDKHTSNKVNSVMNYSMDLGTTSKSVRVLNSITKTMAFCKNMIKNKNKIRIRTESKTKIEKQV